MSKILVVLESPNKVSKVQDYLGEKYLVTSSKGPIRDLDPKSLSRYTSFCMSNVHRIFNDC